MYAKYTTPAVILAQVPWAERDTLAVLYTKDFGLVHARASGARTEHSKMRSALHVGALATVSLVKGKAGWRLAGAQNNAHALSVEDTHVFARAARLVRRLVVGEEANEYLYTNLRSFVETLLTTQGERGALELIAVARILYGLGYVSAEALREAPAVLATEAITLEGVSYASEKRRVLLEAVNSAIAASQL